MVEGRIGFLISDENTPNEKEVLFLCDTIDSEINVGEFVGVEFRDKTIVARIEELRYENPKYADKEFLFFNMMRKADFDKIESANESMFLFAKAKILGILENNIVERLLLPLLPGSKVRKLREEEIMTLLGFRRDGLKIGKLVSNHSEVYLDPSSFIDKHIAILAMTGTGKTNLVKILVSELLEKENDYSIVIIDVHGEYKDLAKMFPERTHVIDANGIKIAYSHLNVNFLRIVDPFITDAQLRAFREIINSKSIATDEKPISIEYLINKIHKTGVVKNIATRETLLARLEILRDENIFYSEDVPKIRSFLNPSKLFIIDMKQLNSLKKKQILTYHILSKLFYLKTTDDKSSKVLFILEEVQNFAPEGVSKELAISKGIIETIAREGRKFGVGLCITSQRPVQIDTTLLSQCNTNFFLRITNSYDLEHIGKTSEFITKEFLNQIPDLSTGISLMVGQASRFPIFFKVDYLADRLKNKKSEEIILIPNNKDSLQIKAPVRYDDQKEHVKKTPALYRT